MSLPDVVLTHKFSGNANISEYYKQLVRATLKELKYNTMKQQLKRCSLTHKFYCVIKGRIKLKIRITVLHLRCILWKSSFETIQFKI